MGPKLTKVQGILLVWALLGIARAVESAVPVREYARVFVQFGQDREQDGKLSPALAFYQQALRYDPGSAETNYQLGIAYRRTGDLAKAVQHAEQAVILSPSFHQAFHALGEAYRDNKEPAPALKAFERAYLIYPHHPFVNQYLYDLALAHLAAGDRVLAMRWANELSRHEGVKIEPLKLKICSWE